ncbi:MAG: lysylphosphatidylglycerol synthase transmembrane domain-containing protein [bacterium]
MRPTTARTKRMAWAAYCAALLALLAVAMRRLDVVRLAVALHTVRGSWIALATLCYASLVPLWSQQWHMLAPASPRNTFGRMFGVVAVTSTTLNTTVLLFGEATGVLLLVTRVGLERSAALSVLAMDQLLVGIAKLAVLLTATWLLPIPAWMARGMTGLAVGVGALLVAVLIGAWHFDAIAQRAGAYFPTRAVSALHTMGVALAPLRSPSLVGSALALAFVKKGAELCAILCVQQAFGVALPVSASILILAALGIATMLPLAPANLGVYEGVVAVVYARFGVPAEQAVGMAIIQHASYLAAVALPGYAWLARSDPARKASAA